MTYDWEPYKETCYRLYVEEKKSLRQLHKVLQDEHNFAPSLRGLHYRLQQWNFPAKTNPNYKNEALIARLKELWETNHQLRDMLAILQDEGFDVQERDINYIRQKNRWLLRHDVFPVKKKRPASASQGGSPENEPDGDEAENEGEVESSATPGFAGPGSIEDALGEMDFTQAQAEAFQEARKRAIAAEAEERRVTKKRRRWLKPRAGLPADPPGPPRFPSELSLTECKAVLLMDAAAYKDVRAKFRAICEQEGVVKKTVAGPHKWEAIKLQLVRESMHLRGVFWDNMNVDQKNLALDLICCDVTKTLRAEGSKMLLHEARNILGLNPKLGRDVRFRFQKILHEDHFAGKILAGEEHWNELVQRWLSESDVLRPIAESLNGMDPDFARKKRAIEVVARDAMKRFRDDEARGTLAKLMEYERRMQEGQDDANGETDHENVANDTSLGTMGFDGSFEAADDAQIAAQLAMDAAAGSGPPLDPAISESTQEPPSPAEPAAEQPPAETPVPPKRKRGRPRKLPYPDNPVSATASTAGEPQSPVRRKRTYTTGEQPAKTKRGRQVGRIPHEEAMRIYAHSQARFLPPDALAGQAASSASAAGAGAFTSTAPASIPSSQSSPVHTTNLVTAAPATSAPILAQAQTQSQAPGQAFVQASIQEPTAAPAQRATTAIYFRLQPTSTITGVPSMWIATLASRSFDELRSKAVGKSPGARCAIIDGIVKDGFGGETPLPIPGDTELGAYLDHMQEIHGPPTFSVKLVTA